MAKRVDINAILRAHPVPGRYGAPLGRRNVFSDSNTARLYVQQVQFVDGDYSADGTYWGGSSPLFAVFTPDLETLCFYRAGDRMAALREFDAEHGEARREALKHFARMSASLHKGGATVQRRPGAPRARTEAHFWGMVRDELNSSYAGEYKYCWTLTRPHKYALTGMPFALKRHSGEMLIDSNYAIRDVRALYNAGETVQLQGYSE